MKAKERNTADIEGRLYEAAGDKITKVLPTIRREPLSADVRSWRYFPP